MEILGTSSWAFNVVNSLKPSVEFFYIYIIFIIKKWNSLLGPDINQYGLNCQSEQIKHILSCFNGHIRRMRLIEYLLEINGDIMSFHWLIFETNRMWNREE